jgi:hypothetical protein
MTTYDPGEEPQEEQGKEEQDLPDKPPITDPMPDDEELAKGEDPGEEDVPEDDVMTGEDAAADDTVDDAEDDTE